MMTASRRYQQLEPDKREIRLLHIKPGVWTDEISCDLTTVSLDDNPKYAALSYVWGNATATERIALCDEPFDITVNLAAALRRLRRGEETVVIWADAVCINQKDVHERNKQVEMMAEIYTTCTEVIVWLEDATRTNLPDFDGSKPALSDVELDTAMDVDQESAHLDSWMSNLKLASPSTEEQPQPTTLDAFQLLHNLASGLHWCVLRAEPPRFHRGYKMNFSSSDTLATLILKVSQRPWWDRVWTVQEILLPKTAIFYYNYIRASWNLFQKLLRAYPFQKMGCKLCQSTKIETMMDQALTGLVIRINDIESSRRLVGNSNLFETYASFRHRKATDPRDMVFALAGGLCSRRLKSMPGMYSKTVLPHEVDIAYQMEFREVFTRNAWLWIRAAATLDVLIFTGEEKRDELLPSWVPDWTAHPLPSKAQIKRSRLPLLQKRYRASGEYGALAEWHQGSCLSVRGIYVDTIRGRKPEQDAINQESPPAKYPAGGLMQDAFWRTWILDTVNLSTGTRRAVPSDQAFFKTWMINLDKDDTIGTESNAGEQEEQGVSMPSDFAASFNQSAIAHDCGEFFFTRKWYMGQSILPPQPGDEVYVLYGCRMPIILRPDSTKRQCASSRGTGATRHATVVGPCYVHGFMDGEALGDPELLKCTVHLN